MILAKVEYRNNKFYCLEVKGHANYDEEGKDIVCSAVSGIITGGFNNLKEIKKFEYTLAEGNCYLKVKEPISDHDEVVIETIVSGLKTIEESNPKFIKVKNL